MCSGLAFKYTASYRQSEEVRSPSGCCKVNEKFGIEQATKAQRESRGIALLFL